MVDFLLNYWLHIVIGILFISGVISFILNQRKNIKEWLLYAVVEAEKELGSNTGKIKLRQVFNWFVHTFPIMSKLVSFNTFSSLVDMALEEMEKMLATNDAIKSYVERG